MDIFKNNLMVGVGVALGATVLAPVLIPVLGSIGRPFAKSLIKGGMMLYEKGREAVAVAGESVEDMMAEIRAEEAAGGAGRAPAQPEPAAQPKAAEAKAPEATGAQPGTPAQAGAGVQPQPQPGNAPV
jgi:hypothetical protein